MAEAMEIIAAVEAEDAKIEAERKRLREEKEKEKEKKKQKDIARSQKLPQNCSSLRRAWLRLFWGMGWSVAWGEIE
eukprot:1922286-Amphidinium_carterae.1